MQNNGEIQRRVEQLEAEVKELKTIVMGERGTYGLVLKVDVLWKILAGVVVALCGWFGVRLQNLLSKL